MELILKKRITPKLYMIMQATQERFFIFISKLEGKLKEFTEASIPELITINNSDTGQFRREYLRMKSAVLGQMENIVKKAREVKEEKITYFPYDEDDLVTYLEFRTECYDRFYQLEELYQDCRERIDSTDQEDYEVKYQKILDEYETIKDQFRCTQCGSPVPIEKIYFKEKNNNLRNGSNAVLLNCFFHHRVLRYLSMNIEIELVYFEFKKNIDFFCSFQPDDLLG